jgi:hypothetical protein
VVKNGQMAHSLQQLVRDGVYVTYYGAPMLGRRADVVFFLHSVNDFAEDSEVAAEMARRWVDEQAACRVRPGGRMEE